MVFRPSCDDGAGACYAPQRGCVVSPLSAAAALRGRLVPCAARELQGDESERRRGRLSRGDRPRGEASIAGDTAAAGNCLVLKSKKEEVG